MSDYLTQAARAMLQSDPEVIEDARKFAPVSNSVAGSILAITHRCPRQYAEQAILEALHELDGGAS